MPPECRYFCRPEGQSSWDWSYRQFCKGSPGYIEEQEILITAEPPLQPQFADAVFPSIFTVCWGDTECMYKTEKNLRSWYSPSSLHGFRFAQQAF